MKKKIALVLEGGGMRGAYTAGCLAWFIDHNIDIANGYGISTGAIHLCSYLLKEKNYLYDLSTNYIADKKLVGWRPLLREGKFVGYNYLFDTLLPHIFHFDIQKLISIASHKHAKIGLYDLAKQRTIYINLKDIDTSFKLLKAATTLPIIGKAVKYKKNEYLDGGISEMIPIKEAINDNNEKFIVISTKPADYIRKPAKNIIIKLMALYYHKYPQIAKDYAIRHQNYNNQVQLVKDLVNQQAAIFLYPSKQLPVSRTSGDKETLKKLFALGYSDTQKKEKEIKAFLEGER